MDSEVTQGNTTNEAIRAVLLQKAKERTETLTKRLSDAAEHLERGEHRAVIGALEGCESDIGMIRTFMQLIRDCF